MTLTLRNKFVVVLDKIKYMSLFTNNQKSILAFEVARAAKITLFGLHYIVDWKGLKNKAMIIKALELNDIFDYFTDVEKQCLEDKLINPNNSCITCS